MMTYQVLNSETAGADVLLLNELIVIINKQMKANAGKFSVVEKQDAAQKKIFLIEQIMAAIYAYVGMPMPRYSEKGKVTEYLLTSHHNFLQKPQLFPEIEVSKLSKNPHDFIALVNALRQLINTYDSVKEKKVKHLFLIGPPLKKGALLLPGFKKKLKSIIAKLEGLAFEVAPANDNLNNQNNVMSLQELIGINDVFLEICVWLSAKSILKLAQTSHFFYKKANQNQVWKNLLQRNAQHVSEDKVRELSQWYNSPKKVYRSLYTSNVSSPDKNLLNKLSHTVFFNISVPAKEFRKKLKKEDKNVTLNEYIGMMKALDVIISSNYKLNKYIFNAKAFSSRRSAISTYVRGSYYNFVLALDMTEAELSEHRRELTTNGLFNQEKARSLDFRGSMIEVFRNFEQKPEEERFYRFPVKFNGQKFGAF